MTPSSPALSVALILTLTASTVPVAAQEQIGTPPNPIGLAITREVGRFAAEHAVVDATQQAGESSDGWSRVRKLKPGAEITVNAKGSQPGKRYLLSADESGITMLNLTGSTLTGVVTGILRDVASHDPAHFIDAQKGGTFLLDKHVRFGPDGVFVADQKVADLAQVVETIARPQVAELRVPTQSRHVIAKGVGIGTALGLGVGLLLGKALDCSRCSDQGYGVMFGALYGVTWGAIGGLVAGVIIYASGHDQVAGDIYLAP